MLLRRVTEDVRNQNWVAIGIDFAIVVIGVFIGLQATSWNEERIAHSRAETYYQRLAADLKAELVSRDARIRYYEQTKKHAVAALRALSSPEPSFDETLLIDVYQATQRWNYAPQRTTYDELIAAGIADAIPDVEIRTRVANLYVGLEQSAITQQEPMPFRDELRRQLPHEVQSAIREICDDRYRFGEGGTPYLELPVTCDLSMDVSTVEQAVAALGEYEDVDKDLARHVAILDSKLKSLRGNESPIREMIALLETQ